MPQNQRLNWWTRWSSTTWLHSMVGLFAENKHPRMTWCVWSDTFRNHQVQNVVRTSSKPRSLLPANLCHSWSVWSCFPAMWSSHQGTFISLNDQRVIQVGGPKWNPLACPRSVSSGSLATEVQSTQHPLLQFSSVPLPSSEGTDGFTVLTSS